MKLKLALITLCCYDDPSCCLDFVSGAMVLDIQSCSEEASFNLSCLNRDRWVVKHRYGLLPGQLSGAFAFASQTWMPTMIIQRHCFWCLRSWYSLLCQVTEVIGWYMQLQYSPQQRIWKYEFLPKAVCSILPCGCLLAFTGIKQGV